MLSRNLFQTALRALPAFRFAAQIGSSVVKFSSPIMANKALFHSSAVNLGKIKTKSTAAKRFIKTGKGDLKYGRAGRRHLNKHKSRTRVRRLGEGGILEGVWAKKMKILVPY